MLSLYELYCPFEDLEVTVTFFPKCKEILAFNAHLRDELCLITVFLKVYQLLVTPSKRYL